MLLQRPQPPPPAETTTSLAVEPARVAIAVRHGVERGRLKLRGVLRSRETRLLEVRVGGTMDLEWKS